VSELLVDQVEFADVLVVSKPDLVDEHDLAQVVALVRRLNPDAEIVNDWTPACSPTTN
jgi:G3E family GTPase